MSNEYTPTTEEVRDDYILRYATESRLRHNLFGEAFDRWLTAHDAEVAAKARADVRQLLADMTDPDDCWFDHNGGCQAHGYLTLKPGELCPHAEAKKLLAEQAAGIKGGQ